MSVAPKPCTAMATQLQHAHACVPCSCSGRRQRLRCSASAATPATPVAAAAARLRTATKVQLRTSSQCKLAVSRYPMFAYNAGGGGGGGSVQQLGGDKLRISFDPAALDIPALNWRTASVFGIPIPPPLNIAIQPRKFEGVVDLATGRTDMEFEADFCFTAGGLYTAPPLKVATTLTSEHSAGDIHAADGRRLADGSALLVGVARVPRVEADWFLNAFLMLPTDALAVMQATLEFS